MQVDLNGVGHRFGMHPWLFRHLTEHLLPGHIYALTGPSGSGKSTLLSLIAGWEKPAEGSITTTGIQRTNWVFQNPHGVAGRTARDHVAFPLLARGLSGKEADQAAEELLARFHLGDVAGQAFRHLSGGEAQRLMLARGIASDPDLLLVDEPTAQLDLHTSRKVNAALHELTAWQDVIVVIATHDEQTRAACTDAIDLRNYQDDAARVTADAQSVETPEGAS